jgi:tetratricopeptide (TPR) repeat protein
LGGLLIDLSDLPGAKRFLDFALMYIKEKGDPIEMAEILRDLSEVEMNLGSVRDAEVHLLEAMELFTGLEDTPGVVEILRMLADVRLRRGDRVGAVSCFRDALEHLGGLDDSGASAEVTLELGRLLDGGGEWEEAGSFYFDASVMLLAQGRKGLRADALNGFGVTLGRSGDLDGAERALQEALEAYEGLARLEGVASAALIWGWFLGRVVSLWRRGSF